MVERLNADKEPLLLPAEMQLISKPREGDNSQKRDRLLLLRPVRTAVQE